MFAILQLVAESRKQTHCANFSVLFNKDSRVFIMILEVKQVLIKLILMYFVWPYILITWLHGYIAYGHAIWNLSTPLIFISAD